MFSFFSLAKILEYLGLTKLGFYAVLAVIVLFIGGCWYGCNKIENLREKKSIEKEVDKQEEAQEKKAKTDIELDDQYLKDLKKKESIGEKVTEEVYQEIKKKVENDPELQKFQKEKIKEHLNRLKQVINKK